MNTHLAERQSEPRPDGAETFARRIAQDIAAVHADDVDAKARFPIETFRAAQEAKLLSAQVPQEFGGEGLGMRQLGNIVSVLAESCASSAMVLAMHYSQVACLIRHGLEDPQIENFVKQLPQEQWLVGSMTSEVGTFGDMRRSRCAVQRNGEQTVLDKDATTGSYCEEADAILVTARSGAQAPENDQVLVLVQRAQRTLSQTTNWNTLGMRGTCSPGFKLRAVIPPGQIFSTPFSEIAAMTMVPYSHILWSALWTGIATGAYRKAAAFIRQQARGAPGSMPSGATRLAMLNADLQALRHNWTLAAIDFDAEADGTCTAIDPSGMRWALRMNNLKVAASETAPKLVHGALQTIGVLAYKNDGPFSLGREYRDVLSGSLMISNDRINTASASILLVSKEA
ncbi:acyl-CoA dehydrogenase [Variovorax boronicumulans]|uniref:acyl-CoA dehydrogenase family protein n=1 Tax=Variovorax boronicumulans TaxID=436515 RepID=UPI00278282DA|nr:acyl-CoA dehydrogenase family protein [Variovorax boronicumulans]MDP9912356.1 acyl-CoA dehydrogenase [Variovorax boronicumulans]